VLSQSKQVHFLVTGADKSRALHAALDTRTDTKACPAAGVQLADGQVTWWADAPAAGTR
jgi:6-phosphogluconolactonase/glucosamine-6-phosphate isomerase/deaminase